MSKELKIKTPEELCAIAARLKLQLLEARFKQATGEIEKLHVIKQIRRTIAQILTELRSRNLTVTIGSHGVALHNILENTTKAIAPEELQKIIDKQQKELDVKSSTKTTSKIKAKLSSAITSKKEVSEEQAPKLEAKKEQKIKIKSQTANQSKAATMIKKTVGGN